MIKVYSYDFSDESHSLDDLAELIGRNRYEYCKKMKSKKAGLCSAYAFILLRHALNDAYGIRDIPRFEFNDSGKPFLKGRTDINFNLSHSGNRVLCAVSNRPVGVDVQEIRKINTRTAEKFLYENELEKARESSDENTFGEELCRLWCIKESYGKYTGKGFGEGFRSFDAYELIEIGRVRCTRKDNYFLCVCGEWDND